MGCANYSLDSFVGLCLCKDSKVMIASSTPPQDANEYIGVVRGTRTSRKLIAMEHLFFEPDENDTSGTKLAYENDKLSMDWSTTSPLIDFVSPKTLWLDFAHNRVPPPEDLLDYPASTGWHIDHIWNGHLNKAHRDLEVLDSASVSRRVASFLQSWLYFGTLETILCKKVEVSYLMRRDSDNRNFLYTQNLHYCLSAKVFHIRIKEHKRKLEVQLRMGKALFLARDWIMRLYAFGTGTFKEKLDRDYPGFMDLVSDTAPAIVRLIEAIIETMLHVFEDWPMQSIANLYIPFAAMELRRTKLRNKGWCDFQIGMLEATTNQSTMDWIANTDLRQDTPGHENCTEMACDRNDVDVSTYKQQHCVIDCHCAPLFLDQSRVEEILERNQLPVICVEQLHGEPYLTVEAADKSKPGDYVAISHVWVDGLGGSTEKGLLTCQVHRIHSLVRKVTKAHPEAPSKFWIDSLCIPPHSSSLWMAALIGIRDVYVCATLVLVIDRLIQKCSPVASTEKLFASIYMSAWMQRMWTYEEAVLAKRLVFLIGDDEFHDLNFSPGSMQPSMRRTVSVVWRTLGRQLYWLRTEGKAFSIGHVYHAFRFRLTNAKGDEFLSVASLLRFSAGQLDALEHVKREERARLFWLMLRDIPADVVFIQGPKLSLSGFHWAPRTMMYPSATGLSTGPNSQKSICTTDGLIGTYLYLRFDRRLQGCNAYPHQRLLDRVINEEARSRNQNFIIWVEDDKSTGRLEDKGMAFRIYCDETWPAPPDSTSFDGVIILTVDNVVPISGQMVPLVALLRQEPLGASPATHLGDNLVCNYIGTGMVERLRLEEFAHATPTIMYTGANYTLVEAYAELRASQLCIR
jgi:hypothetical protein